MSVAANNNYDNNGINVARQQLRPGIQTELIFTLRPHPVADFAMDGTVLRVGFDGGYGGGGHDEGSLDRGYEFPPHRGRQIDREYHRSYYESEGEEEY